MFAHVRTFAVLFVIAAPTALLATPFEVVFMIGEKEYDTRTTLPEFAAAELEPRGVRCTFVHVSPSDKNDFPGLEALERCDLLLISVRRRAPKKAQLALVREFIDVGKPVLGIRTASHAFGTEAPKGHASWESFDNDIFGGDYQGHCNNKPPDDPPSEIQIVDRQRNHRILSAVSVDEFTTTSHLYKNRDMADTTAVLMRGWVRGRVEDTEPVAWTNRVAGRGKVFYTSLGSTDDFRIDAFRQLLLNAVFWSADREPPGLLRRPLSQKKIDLTLRSRDPKSGEVALRKKSVDPRECGIVVVDMWNWHWCKTSTQRVASFVPRLIRTTDAARELGMQVFWCPTDAVEFYNGLPQREAAIATESVSLPDVVKIDCPKARDGGGCTCGPEKCSGNWGWDAMHPDIRIHARDLLPNDPGVLYSLCRARGIRHLIYAGVHTQVCLLGKSIGLAAMKRAGMDCLLARDLTDAHGVYLPAENFTPDDLTAQVVEHFEKYLTSTIDFAAEMERLTSSGNPAPVDPVRVSPWGTKMRPHHFTDRVVISLTTPLQEESQIYLTLDGSEPGRHSIAYTGPFALDRGVHLRSVAFQGEKPVCSRSEAHFVRRNAFPPEPDVHLSNLEAKRAVGPGHSPSATSHRFDPFVNPPQKNLSNRKSPLELCGQSYEKGMGVHATNQLVYAIEPDYDRFVALAGVDEEIVSHAFGTNRVMHASVVFRVFVDGALQAESPVMRIGEQPWRFDVKIPVGSRTISLVASDAGDGNKEDRANWVNVGFVLRDAKAN